MITTISIPVHLYRPSTPFGNDELSYTPNESLEPPTGQGHLKISRRHKLTDAQQLVAVELALAALRLIVGTPVTADMARISVDTLLEDGSHRATVSLPAHVTIIQAPLSSQEQDELTALLGSLRGNEADPERYQRLERSLRFFGMAVATSEPVEKFIFAWIALESLYRVEQWRDEGQSNTDGIHDAFDEVYSSQKSTNVGDRLRQIYGLRNGLFHEAALPPAEIVAAGADTILILRDCLKDELGLTPSYKGAQLQRR